MKVDLDINYMVIRIDSDGNMKYMRDSYFKEEAIAYILTRNPNSTCDYRILKSEQVVYKED